MELKGKTAVITGGAMGIGLATAKRLVHEGCAVTIWDLNEQALAAAVAELKQLGGSAFGHRCDVTDMARVYELAKIAAQEMGRVDILVNNAGYVMAGGFLEQSETHLETTIKVNLTAFIYTIRAFLPAMLDRNVGHIVNISSAAALLGVPEMSMYSATKWAVLGLTESMRLETWNRGKKGVRWSSVHPNYIAHGMFGGAKLGWFGNLFFPLLKDHDVVAKAIVEGALKKGRYSPKRPRSLRMASIVRGLTPDFVMQHALVMFGVTKSMSTWHGHTGGSKTH